MTTITAQATGSWTSAPDLPAAATWYGQHDGAVLLAAGNAVLVAGGADSTSAAVNHSAVHDATAGTWLAVGALNTPRRLHTLTLLTDGKVLATGGTSGPAPNAPALATTELYDPATRAWTASGSMAGPRAGHSAALLSDGKVLVAGGTTVRSAQTTKALRTAEVYDPATGTWSAAGDMTEARTGHTAVPLSGGAVLVCGGTAPVGTAAEPALAFCELYDTTTKKWTPTGSLRAARSHHQATPLSGTKVLITGGAAPGAPGGGPFDPFSQRTAEVYDLASGTWQAAADMPSGRALHRALPFGQGKVLVVGGAADDKDEAGYRSTVLYDSATDTWTAAAGLATGRWAFAAAPLPGGKVLVTGGTTRSGTAAADPAVPELTVRTEIFAAGGAS
ncbi:kelch repeat-containing protein [Streptomyces aurantiacus]|uniref:Putative Kelch-like protein 17 n=1 Tax=Streptomyces aurantiacus JA 4570 TaxID=1286094 RepID=S3ZC97_9ACTN|nr:kelch repeat-containing protein [Streptomyces aurantiacus]EPH41321.1 putative Kelch-like protein 17 [Streptomyces aurantiacus JA 4570]